MSALLKDILPGVLSLFLIAEVAFADSIVPPDNAVLDQIAPHSREVLPTKLDLLVWNVHKGADKEAWAHDMASVSSGKEIVLLQEAMKDNFMTGVLRGIPSFGWTFATSWINTPEMIETGISTGSPARAITTHFRRSPGREPFTHTPKMSLITTYLLESGGTLKVVNLHGINFVGVNKYQQQIDDIVSYLKGYPGPLVWAGDFNTWNNGRMNVLLKAVKQLGLTQVKFSNDNRGTKFDHIFVKGCTSSENKLLTTIKTSDHPPLVTTLDCSPAIDRSQL